MDLQSSSVWIPIIAAVVTSVIAHFLMLWRSCKDRKAAYRTALLLWGHIYSLNGKSEIIEHFCINIINNPDNFRKFVDDYKITDVSDFISFLKKNDSADGFSKWFDTNFKW